MREKYCQKDNLLQIILEELKEIKKTLQAIASSSEQNTQIDAKGLAKQIHSSISSTFDKTE
ncbi:MAG TPA: hypothetical protein GX707_20870 [Epulopiscium sp.]|nr:hypothetical protein [Candidatus Epulonipiscium sp.]